MPKFVNHLREFVHSAGREANSMMGGGILGFALAIAQAIRGSSLSAFLFVAVSAIIFSVGAYIAWSKEHEKLLAEIGKNGRPEIQIRLLGALHHILHTDNSISLGPSFVTLHVGLVNVRQVPTTIRDYALKVFLGRNEFTGTLVASNVRFSMEREKFVAHRILPKRLRIRKVSDVETIVPLDETITHKGPLVYMLEQTGYMHFVTDLPIFEYEIKDDPVVPAEFTIVLTLTDPMGGVHVGRFEKVPIEPANLRIVGTEDEKLLRERARNSTEEDEL